MQNGSVWDLVLSEDRAQRYIFVADGANMQVVTIDRQTGEKLSSFGRPGRMAGNFKWVHNMAIDSKGNHLHGRGRRRPARAEVQAAELTLRTHLRSRIRHVAPNCIKWLGAAPASC